MDFFFYLSLFLILWGAGTLFVALRKPAAVWKLGKIQGFVQLLGEKGTVIFFVFIGVATIAGGIYLLVK